MAFLLGGGGVYLLRKLAFFFFGFVFVFGCGFWVWRGAGGVKSWEEIEKFLLEDIFFEVRAAVKIASGGGGAGV